MSAPKIVKNDKMASGQEVTWDSVYFGSYPQAEVVDTEKSKNYTEIDSIYRKDGDLIVDDDLYTALLTAPSDDWDANGEITLHGSRYRRIRQEDAVNDNADYKWPDSITYHYFKYEPIRWRVLSTDGNMAMLLSDVALDGQRYQTELKGIAGTVVLNTTWEKSSMRSWLNGYGASSNSSNTDFGSRNFIDIAFTEQDQAAVMDTSVVNSVNLSHGTDGGNDTTDKIFLLSESEVYGMDAAQSYGFAADSGIYDEARLTGCSTYAKAVGVLWVDRNQKYAGNTPWCLRSPGIQCRSYCAEWRNDPFGRHGK